MRRLLVITALSLLAAAGALAAGAGADDTHTYEIEMYNAFGIVEGSDVRVSGVNAGRVTGLDVNAEKRAVVTVELEGELAELGERTRCSSEPQSLIAEYFIDCDPQGPPLPDGGTVPASRVAQTVQPDLVQNTLREPYRERLQLLINEFGTGLAGNAAALNEAIRLGAPALTETRKATAILAEQNQIIRDLTVDSDRVIGELAGVREDVVEFVDEAEDTAAASAARREDLSRDFELLDDFLAELDPTLAGLERLATTQVPLLTDLRASAPRLNRLALDLPAFGGATEESLSALGEASLVGTRAVRTGRDEVKLLAEAARNAPVTAEALADFARDIDDPRRIVEINDRAAADTGRTNPEPEQKDTKGYTGFEGLLNWFYYLTGATAQFDQVAHSTHINLYTLGVGPCAALTSGRDPQTGAPGVPAAGGGTTTNLLEADECVQWLGPNQPGITEDLGFPPYPSEVCPNGTAPAAAEPLCSPAGAARGAGDADPRAGSVQATGAGGGRASASPASPAAPGASIPAPTDIPDEALQDALGLPDGGGGGGNGGGLGGNGGALQDLLDGLGNGGGGLGGGGLGGGGLGGGGLGGGGLGGGGVNDLLDFLFKP